MNSIFTKRARRLSEHSKCNKKRKLKNNIINNFSNCSNVDKTNKYKSISLNKLDLLTFDNTKIITHRKYDWLVTKLDGITNDGQLVKINCPNIISKEIPKSEWINIQLNLEISNLKECLYIENRFMEVDHRLTLPEYISNGSSFYKGKFFRWALLETKSWTVQRDYKWFKTVLPNLLNNQVEKELTLENILNSDNPEQEFKFNYNDWVSATKTRNYLINDTVCDYLDLYKKPGTKTHHKTHLNELFQKGKDFETALVDYLYNEFPNEITTIVPDTYFPTFNHFKQTYNEIQKGTPLICQAALYNFEDKTYGTADLLIRSDYINKIFKSYQFNSNKVFYIVADIKLHKLHMTSDSKHLQNSNSVRAFKGQVLVYNRALALLQNYNPNFALIIGRGWKSEKTINKRKIKLNSINCFDRPGIVDFSNKDAHFNKSVDEAINWIRLVRTDGSKWSILPKPSVPQLYPNMSVSNNYYKYKKYLADELDEITNVFYCGIKHRNAAHENGIYRWSDPKCTSKNINLTGKRIPFLVDSILNVNRGNTLVTPEVIKLDKNDVDWTNQCGLYVDFETVSDVFNDFNDIPNSKSHNLIFLIGCGWIEDNKWNYKYFCAKRLTSFEEKRILNEWYQFMYSMNFPTIYHYGHHEKSSFNCAKNNHKLKWDINNWYDVYQNIIYKYPVCVNGSLKLSLKSIGKALYKHGLINTAWIETSNCLSGLDAMTLAKKCNKDAIKRNIKLECLPEIQDIIKYNHVDCKIMYEIIDYLAKNHVKIE